MTKQNRKTVCMAITATALIFIAWICRIPSLKGFYDRERDFVRFSIWIGLIMAWGISVRKRIIQTQVRGYLTCIDFLMLFWFLIRTAKFHFISAADHPVVVRYIWYLYYLPMMFIPLLAVFVAMSVGRPEDYRLPRRAMLLCIPTVVLFLLVMTNDLHQFVFTFPADAVWTASNNGYGAGYYFIVAWLSILALIMLVKLLKKSRLRNSHRLIILPNIPILIFMGYVILYYLHVDWLRFIFGDLTAMACLLYIATIELCIQCRFIQSNTHYRELFDASTVGAQITDEEYNICLFSQRAKHVDAELLCRTENGPVMLDHGIRLSGAPIHGGHVIWSEDLSPLLKVLEELEEIKENLEDSNAILEEENALKAREAHIAEQKRLYQIIERDTEKQIRMMEGLIAQAEGADTDEEKRKLLKKMLVVGTYLKRRSNLVFLADRSPVIEAKELYLMFGESLDNLEMCGVTCGFHSELTEPFLALTIMSMYDFFEEVIERSLDGMESLTVYVGKMESVISFVINTDADADFTDLISDTVTSIQDEDGEWQLILRLDEGSDTE